jgi:hypothetical protein
MTPANQNQRDGSELSRFRTLEISRSKHPGGMLSCEFTITVIAQTVSRATT